MSDEYDSMVVVEMITYNHGSYIAQAIESVLIQKTSFKFKLLICEDFSTDGTREICIDYKNRFPHLIDLHLNVQNIGVTLNSRKLHRESSKCNSKYIALCDGDDFWTDPLKLQKQVDYLESHTEIAGCFHDVITVDKQTNLLESNYYISPKEIFNQLDCLTYGGAYATCSLVCRAMVFNNMPEWFLKSPSDYTIDLLITEFGDIAYLPQNMGAYRIHTGGTWQGNLDSKNWESVIERYQACLTNPKFKKNYSNFFYGRIAEFSSKVALFYKKEKQYLKELKYVCYFIYYGRPTNLRSFHHLIGVLLFPSLYKSIRSFFPIRSSK